MFTTALAPSQKGLFDVRMGVMGLDVTPMRSSFSRYLIEFDAASFGMHRSLKAKTKKLFIYGEVMGHSVSAFLCTTQAHSISGPRAVSIDRSAHSGPVPGLACR